MFCWCLNLRNGTNNEYSQLLFIYQITPDSFTIDKSEYDVMHMEHREKGQASNIPSRHRRGTGDIILDYTGFGFFFSFCDLLPPPAARDHWTQIHQCPGRLERDRKIKLTVFIMWLYSIRGHLFKRSRFGGANGGEKVFFHFLFTHFVHSPSPSPPRLDWE